KSLSNDEAERRTRRIHHTFKRVILFSFVIGLVIATQPAVEGNVDKALERLAFSLAFGILMAPFATPAYGILICPGRDISGAEVLERRRRKAKRNSQAEGPTGAERPFQGIQSDSQETERDAAVSHDVVSKNPRREDNSRTEKD